MMLYIFLGIVAVGAAVYYFVLRGKKIRLPMMEKSKTPATPLTPPPSTFETPETPETPEAPYSESSESESETF